MSNVARSALAAAAASVAILLLAPAAYAIDGEAALALAKKNSCFKCHTIEDGKEKDGPAYKKVAEKYKDKPEAEKRIIEHITTGETTKFADGHEEEHKIIKTSPPKDMEQIKNLVQWILSQ
ncbi:MAG: c-type cytochrome [Rhodocyclales bacterium]|nr:c-type cytochrome [Rhodocyclales bacterium]